MAAPPENHIHAYFAKYPDFEYRPENVFLEEFRRLSQQKGWNSKADKVRLDREKRALQDAMVKQFNLMYGKRSEDLHSWQSLLVALGVAEIPGDIAGCRKILKKTHVNLVDFVHRPKLDEPVRTFNTEIALSNYTRKHEKYFPRSNVHAGSLIKDLLRNISKPSHRRNGGVKRSRPSTA